MKKIIVPIDFSEYSDYALQTAAKIAKKTDAEILALHMLEMSQAALTTSDSEQQSKAFFFLKLAEKRFEEFLNKSYLEDVTVTPIVKHFKVFKEVNDVAKEHNADLIIMGSHGVSGIKEVLVGSNTEKVVRHSDIPVLVVKNDPAIIEFKNAIFACDFSSTAVEPFINARNMANTLGANLHIVHVNLPNISFRSSVEIEKRAAEFLKKAEGHLEGLDKINYVSDYSVENGVLNFANKLGADLVTIPTHGRKGIAHFFEGSISEDIANHSTLPVMTFKM